MKFFIGPMDTPMHDAVMNGSLAVEQAIKDEENVEPRKYYNPRNYYTPLLLACERSDARSAQLLIENGANVNAKNSTGMTPFLYAIEKNMYNLVTFMIIRQTTLKFNIYHRTSAGFNALHVAVVNDRTEIAEHFLEKTYGVASYEFRVSDTTADGEDAIDLARTSRMVDLLNKFK